MGEKKFLESIEDGELDIAVYARSWEEGDNVTVTCDLLFAMEQAVGVFNEQKVKIERLKATGLLRENEQLKKDLQRKELLRQKAVLYAEEKQAKNAELQKQVDELKTKQVIECYGMIKGCDMVKQAVKDTAKEIYEWLLENICESEFAVIMTYFRERYGVEVK